MPAPSQPLPTIGEDNVAADPKVRSVLVELQSILTGNVDTPNVSAAFQQLLHSPGDIKASARAAPEAGWIACDGGEVPSQYTGLIAALAGNPHGTGANGRPLVPDLRGRVPVGVGTAAGDVSATAKTLGAKGGNEKHTLAESEMPAHSHGPGGAAGSNGYVNTSVAFASALEASAGGQQGWTTNTNTGSTGGSQPHNNLPPYAVINFFIKT